LIQQGLERSFGSKTPLKADCTPAYLKKAGFNGVNLDSERLLQLMSRDFAPG